MAEETEIHQIGREVHEIDTRLSVVEAGVRRQESMRKILWGMAGFLLIQFTGIAVGYGKMMTQLEEMDSFRQDSSTILTVLGDHGTEIQSVRDELLRIRSRDDAISDRTTVLEQQLIDRTKDRWYREDAKRQTNELKEWVYLQLRAAGIQVHRQ